MPLPEFTVRLSSSVRLTSYPLFVHSLLSTGQLLLINTSDNRNQLVGPPVGLQQQGEDAEPIPSSDQPTTDSLLKEQKPSRITCAQQEPVTSACSFAFDFAPLHTKTPHKTFNLYAAVEKCASQQFVQTSRIASPQVMAIDLPASIRRLEASHFAQNETCHFTETAQDGRTPSPLASDSQANLPGARVLFTTGARAQKDRENDEERIFAEESLGENGGVFAGSSPRQSLHIRSPCTDERRFDADQATSGPQQQSRYVEGPKTYHGATSALPLQQHQKKCRFKKSSRDANVPGAAKINPNDPKESRPSEEDLLLLLMRRTRVRSEMEVRLAEEGSRLRQENVLLQKENAQHQIQLDTLKKDWRACIHTQHVQEAQLKVFKDKYTKLKQWAQEMAVEYGGLKYKAGILDREIATVRDSITSNSEVTDGARTECEATASRVETLKFKVSELRAAVNDLESVKHSLAEQEGRLKDEQRRCQAYADQIQKLEKAQSSMNEGFAATQLEMLQKLSVVLELLHIQKNEDSASHLLQIRGAVEQSIMQAKVGSIDLDQLKTVLGPLEEQCQILGVQLLAIKDSQSSHKTAFEEHYSRLISSVDSVTPNLAEIQQWKAKATEASLKMLCAELGSSACNRDKRMAQLAALGLLDANKKLIENHGSQTLEEVQSVRQELIETRSEMKTLLESVNSDKDHLQRQLHSAKSRAQQLENRLADIEKSHELQLDDIRASHVHERDAIHQTHQKDIETKIARLTACEEQCKHHEQALDQTQEKLRLIVNEKRQLEEAIKDSQSQFVAQAQDIAKLRSCNICLEEQLQLKAPLEKEVDTIRAQCREHEVTAGTVSQLRDDKMSLQNDLEALKQRIDGLEAANADLTEQLRCAHVAMTELGPLRDTISDQSTRIEQLIGQCGHSETEAARVVDLEIRLKHHQTRVCELEEALNVAQLNAEKLDILTEQIAQYHAQEEVHRKTASEAREKTGTLHELRAQVQALKAKETELNNLQEEVQRKDVELASMQDRINALEDQRRQIQPVRDILTDAELALMTGPICLSLKSMIHQSQTTQQEYGDGNEESQHGESRARNDLNSDEDAVPDSQAQSTMGTCAFHSNYEPALTPLTELPELSDEDVTDHSFLQRALRDLEAPNSQDMAVTRPGTSNEEMLLRSSDALDGLTCLKGSDFREVLVPATANQPSPMKTRNGSQIRHDTPDTRLERVGARTVSFSTPHASRREPHAPNSAKRRNFSEEDEPVGKRHKSDASASELTAAEGSNHISVDTNLHEKSQKAGQTGSAIVSNAPLPGVRRKTNTTKPSKRDARMGRRFT